VIQQGRDLLVHPQDFGDTQGQGGRRSKERIAVCAHVYTMKQEMYQTYAETVLQVLRLDQQSEANAHLHLQHYGRGTQTLPRRVRLRILPCR
jgi:hypothetical protein